MEIFSGVQGGRLTFYHHIQGRNIKISCPNKEKIYGTGQGGHGVGEGDEARSCIQICVHGSDSLES